MLENKIYTQITGAITSAITGAHQGFVFILIAGFPNWQYYNWQYCVSPVEHYKVANDRGMKVTSAETRSIHTSSQKEMSGIPSVPARTNQDYILPQYIL
ncbi:hypothetical protein Metlim_0256 [Methanoplanus limicola DSM 2279]|uniref:Uncharacterized protein n=1 Tax=Methanoplanus limicola DSM 2279 TaxID=937775 RepID=H1Z0D6_9EURY|nr:hypothetical protein Metlim_0256 [Methanoplanus limicola DSM 2279]